MRDFIMHPERRGDSWRLARMHWMLVQIIAPKPCSTTFRTTFILGPWQTPAAGRLEEASASSRTKIVKQHMNREPFLINVESKDWACQICPDKILRQKHIAELCDTLESESDAGSTCTGSITSHRRRVALPNLELKLRYYTTELYIAVLYDS